MKIEDHWLDCSSYLVSFTVNDGRRIEKHILLPPEFDEREVREIIYSSFARVQSIERIDEFESGLIFFHYFNGLTTELSQI